MIDRRRWPNAQLRSGAAQRPTPSGPRCAIRSRIRTITSGSLAARPGLNAPTRPHIDLSSDLGADQLSKRAIGVALQRGVQAVVLPAPPGTPSAAANTTA